LRGSSRAEDRKRVVERIEMALSAMNELFNALLDVTKLDAGALAPTLTEFPVAHILKRIETTFTEVAREKGLSLRVIDNGAWLRSDGILLERIVSNLVSNAIRYTSRGRVLVGCRRRGNEHRLEVWDTGPGIPEDQRQNIFGEFYRIKSPNAGQPSGLGLGLAIVDRLSQLLDHPIDVKSAVGKGSCFSVTVRTIGKPSAVSTKPAEAVAMRRFTLSESKLVVVIDNDPLVLEGMSSLIRSWGCNVVTGESGDAALALLNEEAKLPDLIISDYHLGDDKTGIEAISQLRRTLDAPIPAFLMSGDVNAGPLLAAQAHGYPLLHKPVEPMALRATLTQIIRKRPAAVGMD
jgi:CheY-like chemotaxis protein/anti-sigma regulatory factor (Ser/Thr protein kinase)